MIDKVVLINANWKNYRVEDRLIMRIGQAVDHLGLITLRNALKAAGYNNVYLFPEEPITLNSLSRVGFDGVVKKLKDIVGDSKRVIFGTTINTESYPLFSALSTTLSEEFPEAILVAGGPNFKREKTNEQYKDVVESTLERKLAHAVVVGHGQPLTPLVTDVDGDFISLDVPGLYYLSNGRVKGFGKGGYPEVDELPYHAGIMQEMSTMLRDGCGNGCGFCTVYGNGLRIEPSMAIDGIRKAHSDFGFEAANFHDSNVFNPKGWDYYKQIFDGLHIKEPILKWAYLDPGHLVVDFEGTCQRIVENDFVSVFIGRDCVSGRIAELIGLRYEGKVRDDGQLEAERRAISRFITFLNSSKVKSESFRSCDVRLAYIVTPFETEESATQLVEDVEYFNEMRSDKVFVSTQKMPLMPWPGTEVRAKYFHLIKNPYDFGVIGGHLRNYWSESIGEAYELMNVAASSENTSFCENMRKEIARIYPKPKKLKISPLIL